MKHCSLFNGIGGFQLAAEWMGWENTLSCEIEPLLNKITSYYWPNCKQYEDIRTTDFTIYRGTIDVLTGGFPCQPFSVAGTRKGKKDNRYLWPEMLRAIREIQPRYVVAENVRGLISWSNGMVFQEVQTDLENEGYEVQPFILPACAVNAPHRRDRIWFVAYSNSIRNRRRRTTSKLEAKNKSIGKDLLIQTSGFGKERFASNTKIERGTRLSKRKESKKTIIGSIISYGLASNTYGIGLREKNNWVGKSRFVGKASAPNYWQNFPTQPPVCSRNDGISTELDGITFPKWAKESIKSYGNAIVPQVALNIFKTIEKIDSLIFTNSDKTSPRSPEVSH